MKNKVKKALLATGAIASILAPISVVISCSTTKSVLFQGRRTLIKYIDSSSVTGERNRVWDLSTAAKNMVTNDYFDMSNVSLFRERVTQTSEVRYEKDGHPIEVTPMEEKMTFDGVSSATLEDNSGNTEVFNDAVSLQKKLSGTEDWREIHFKVPSGIKYIDINGNKTKYNFKAIDFFYGLVRSLYANSEIREEAKIQGIDTGLPKMEDSYINRIKASEEWYPKGILDKRNFNNANVYLWNLIDLDFRGTFDSNTGPTADPDVFVLKFNSKINPDAITSTLSGSTLLTVASSEKINELSGKNYNDVINPTSPEIGKRFALLEYGSSLWKNGIADLSNMLSVGRYYFTQFDTRSTKDGGTGIILKKNMHGYDSDFVNAKNNILKYQILVNDSKSDKEIFLQERQRSFLNGENSESLLNHSVLENKALMEPFLGNPKYVKSFKTSLAGNINQGMNSPYFYLAGKDPIGDNESLLLFGKKREDALNDPQSDEEYFNGRGRQFRTLMNNSVNLYSLSKIWQPSSSSIKTSRNYQPGQYMLANKTSEDNTFGSSKKDGPSKFGRSVLSISDIEGSTWYSNNKDNVQEALKPTEANYNKIKGMWSSFITEAKTQISELSNDAEFIIPLYDFRANDIEETPGFKTAYKALIEYLNELTDGTGLKFRELDKSTGSKDEFFITKYGSAPFFYVGAGADYSSVASLVQQLISANYGYGFGAQILTDSLVKNIGGNHVINDFADDSINLTEEFNLNHLYDYITTENTRNNVLYPKLAEMIRKNDVSDLRSMTINDWVKFKKHNLGFVSKNEDGTAKTLSPEEQSKVDHEKLIKELTDEIDILFQKYMFKISTDKDKVPKWTKLLSNYNLGNKLAMGYPSYSSKSVINDGKIPVSKIYSQPWFKQAQKSSHTGANVNYIDTTIEI